MMGREGRGAREEGRGKGEEGMSEDIHQDIHQDIHHQEFPKGNVRATDTPALAVAHRQYPITDLYK